MGIEVDYNRIARHSSTDRIGSRTKCCLKEFVSDYFIKQFIENSMKMNYSDDRWHSHCGILVSAMTEGGLAGTELMEGQ